MKRAHRVMVLGGIVAASIGGNISGIRQRRRQLGRLGPRADGAVPADGHAAGTDNVGPRATPIAANSTYTADVWGTNGNCTSRPRRPASPPT